MFKLLLIALSFVFGLLTVRHLRKYDVHEIEAELVVRESTAGRSVAD